MAKAKSSGRDFPLSPTPIPNSDTSTNPNLIMSAYVPKGNLYSFSDARDALKEKNKIEKKAINDIEKVKDYNKKNK